MQGVCIILTVLFFVFSGRFLLGFLFIDVKLATMTGRHRAAMLILKNKTSDWPA